MQGLLCAKHCFKHFININSFNSYNNTAKQVYYYYPPFYRGGPWETETLCNLPKITQLVNGIQTQAAWLQSPGSQPLSMVY